MCKCYGNDRRGIHKNAEEKQEKKIRERAVERVKRMGL